jgi:7-cyano-7-deazaguanine synthase
MSGGVESATLGALLSKHFVSVHPVYVRFGLAWEGVEESFLRRFLACIDDPDHRIKPVFAIELPVGDVYGEHWSTTSRNVPDEKSDDSSVFLPGRNLLLFSKTTIWCYQRGISTIAIGHLQSNPFPDASSDFFANLQSLCQIGLDARLRIVRPLAHLKKTEVIRLGKDLPLELSFSCIQPVAVPGGEYAHCGRCNKCHERRTGFAMAGVVDRTYYACATGQAQLARR